MNVPLLKTAYRRDKEAREMKIYTEYATLMERKGQQSVAVMEHLMVKFNIHSMSTVYNIIRRTAKRIAEEGVNQ